MITAQANIAQTSAQSEGATTMTEDQIFSQVVGTRQGYAQSLGYGVLPPPSSRVNSSTREELEQTQRRVEEAKKLFEELQQHIKTQEEKIGAQQGQIQSQQEQIQSQQEQITAMEARQKLMEEKMEAFFRSH